MIAYQRIIKFLVILLFVQHLCASAAHFVLVHGSCHGAWCYYKLATLLEEAVHNVTAIDLAYSGRNQIPLGAVHTIDGYHEPLYTYMECLSPGDRVILVGHSYGGLAVSSAMERFPEKIAGGVFLTAYMVGPNLTYGQILEKVFFFGDSIFFIVKCSTHLHQILSGTSLTIGDPPTILLFGPNYLKTYLYQNSPPEDYKLANYSIRVTKLFYDEISQKELLVSREKYGSVPRAYIIAGSDLSFPPDDQRFFIESNPPAVVKEIAGADHLVMFSAPEELANDLQDIASTLGV